MAGSRFEIKCMGMEHDPSIEGKMTLAVAELKMPDKVGDIFAPGCLAKSEVMLSQYNHAIWSGAPPIGVGTVYESGDEIKCDVQFNMEMDAARSTWQAIMYNEQKGHPTEFSIGFRRLQTAMYSENGSRYRVLKSVLPLEVCAVAEGTANNSRVIAMKSAEAEADAGAGAEESEVAVDIDAVLAEARERVREVVVSRASAELRGLQELDPL